MLPLSFRRKGMGSTRAKGKKKSEEEEFYRALTETTTSAIFIYKEDRFCYLNSGMEVLTGYSRSEMMEMGLYDMVHPDFRDLVILRNSDIQGGLQAPARCEFKIITKEGKERWVDFAASATIYYGEPAGLGTAFDITEHKEAELALRESEQRLRSVVLQSKLMESVLRHRADELAELHTLSLDITAALELPVLLNTVVERATRLLHAYGGMLYLCDDKKAQVRCVVSHNTYDDYTDRLLKYGVGAAGVVASSGKPLIIDDYRLYEQRIDVDEEAEGQTAVLTVPMIGKGHVVGVLQLVDNTDLRVFSPADQELLTLFADQAAIAIENARLLEAERGARIQAEMLREVARVVSGSLDLDEVLLLIQDQMARVLSFDTSSVVLIGEKGEFWFVAGRGYTDPEKIRRTAHQFLKESRILQNMVMDLAPVIIEDVCKHPDWIWVPGAEHVRSFVCVPIIAREKVIGALMIDSSKPNYYGQNDMSTAVALAQHMALAIENARLFEQAALERRHLSLLYAVVQELVVNLIPDTILNRALSLTCEALGGLVGEGHLYITEQARLSWRAIYGVDGDVSPALDGQLDLELHQGLCGWVGKNQQAVNISDLSQNEYWLPVPGLDDDAVSAISAPVLEDGRLLGVLTILHRKPGAFTSDHLTLLQAICQQVALALSNAERYQQVQDLVDMLAVEQNRLKSLIERLPAGVLLLDEHHRLLISNPLGREIIQTLNALDENERVINLIDLTLSQLTDRYSETLPVEINWDGPPRHIYEAQACPIGDETRQYVLTIRDVTRERENQIRIQMQERLATVGQLAAGIAHDFNNIMAAILVYTDLLQMDSLLTASSRDRINIIRQQVSRASSLIRQILDFSRRSLMEQSALDLLPYLKELEKLLKRLLPENIQLDLISIDGRYIVSGDPTRLQQVFMNLALNARDAMPSGGKLSFELGLVKLESEQPAPFPDLPPGEWVRIVVSDTGLGVSPEVLPHIFEPFFTTKPVGEGTGLGLAQVYGIIQQHNGFIGAASQLGKGTTFAIYLPSLPVEEMDFEFQESREYKDGEGAVVLLVEDDQATRDALKDLLASQNYRVITAENGVEALQLYLKYEAHVRLVISDVVMPEMGGLKLYDVLQDCGAKVKMLLITGHPVELENQRILEQGKVHWLQKPFSVHEFNESVQALLAGG
jgi:PAS domain S-box-containing protein